MRTTPAALSVARDAPWNGDTLPGQGAPFDKAATFWTLMPSRSIRKHSSLFPRRQRHHSMFANIGRHA
jgi:hypothetical protein